MHGIASTMDTNRMNVCGDSSNISQTLHWFIHLLPSLSEDKGGRKNRNVEHESTMKLLLWLYYHCHTQLSDIFSLSILERWTHRVEKQIKVRLSST